MEILNIIPVNLDLSEINKTLHIKREEDKLKVQALVDIALPLIQIRAAYKVSYIDAKLENAIKLDGIQLTSSVLRKNLDPVERVFPYVITIGPKLEEKARAAADLINQFYLDTIGNHALRKARLHLKNHLCSRYALDEISSMCPGSLEDWPIGEQKNLFSILGDVEKDIGVKLTKHLLMIPRKSVSGIYFPTEITFYCCQLCPRERCESRKARYNEKLVREYGLVESKPL